MEQQMNIRKSYRRTIAGIAISLLLASCVTSPLGRSQLQLFSEEMMSEMGAAAFQNLRAEKKDDTDRDDTAYVNCVAHSVIQALPASRAADWEVQVFADDSPNAFALPGQKVGVHSGLLDVARNQHQLATVIGHEIAHVNAKHGNERLSNAYAAEAGLQLAGALLGDPGSTQSQTVMALLGVGAQVGVLLPFSRAQESEADLLGLDLMARAGFDPAESVPLWENMTAASQGGPPEFLSTHPGPGGRIQALQARIPSATKLQKAALAQGRRPDCAR
jgi:predicted Zn-dependent protease